MFTLIGILCIALATAFFRASHESNSEFAIVYMLCGGFLFLSGVVALAYGLQPVFQQLH
jgi:hypothetical protein